MEPKEALKAALDKKNNITPIDVAKDILGKKEYAYIDVRSKFKYDKGHLPEAINMAAIDVLEEENLEYFKDLKEKGKTAVIYGADAEEGNIPYMILMQVGVENIKLLNGKYEIFEGKKLSDVAKMQAPRNCEVPVMDFAKVIKDAGLKAEEQEKLEKEKRNKKKLAPPPPTKSVSKKVVKPKQKAAPKPVEEEEEEGC